MDSLFQYYGIIVLFAVGTDTANGDLSPLL